MSSLPIAIPARNYSRKFFDGALSAGAVFSAVVHAGAAVVIYNVATQKPLPPVAPIMVSMISAPVPLPLAPAPEKVEPTKPRPVIRKQVEVTKPLLVAEKPAAEPAETAPAPPPPPAPAAPVATPVAEAAATVIPPRFDAAYLDNPAPPYPPMSRRLGEQGKVMLRVLVNADGTAAQVELKTSCGLARLDQSALTTVKRWRFVPAKLGSQAVSGWVQVPILFTLGG